ncbi:hypothetical protein OAO87_03140 [bacterium]|nr:hypothetical protein [bacterium]
MLPGLSEQRESSHRADATSEHLHSCQCSLSSARHAVVLAPSRNTRPSNQRASNRHADAISEHLRCCHGCLSSARQAIVLAQSRSICDAVRAV